MWDFLADILGYWLYQVYLDSSHGTTRKIFAVVATLLFIAGIGLLVYWLWFR
ncbi:MAG: hypothetical protein AMXMBFR58_04970 [Phycisphaerae bacterium]